MTNYIRISGGRTPLYYHFLKFPKLNLRTSELGHIRSEAKKSCTIDYLNLCQYRLAFAMFLHMLFLKQEEEVDLLLSVTER